MTRETWGRAERAEVAALEATLALPAAQSSAQKKENA